MTEMSDEYYFRHTDWWMDIPFNPGPPERDPLGKWTGWGTAIHSFQEAFIEAFKVPVTQMAAVVEDLTNSFASLSSTLEKAGMTVHLKREIGKPRINNTGPRNGPAFDRGGRKRY